MTELMKPLTKQQEDLVLSEIGYSRVQLKKDLGCIKEWLQQQQHFPPSCLNENDEFLQMFLTGCKGSLEKAKRKLDNYYKFRGDSELLENRDPLQSGYSSVIDISYIGLIPEVNDKGDRIAYISLEDPDPEKFDLVLHLRRFINLLEIKLRMEGISSSHYIILDNKSSSGGHVYRVNPLVVRDLLRLIQEILPFRIKGLLFINCLPILDSFFNKLVVPFLSKKLKERLLVTSKGPEILQKYFDKSLIPMDYGGENLSLKELSAAWRKHELEKREWFLDEVSQHTDESKRINLQSNVADPYFGVHGSLKKLVID